MGRPGKIVCVGRNYAAHARELGHAVPAEPLLFLKPSSAVIGPGDAIVLPRVSRQVDYEGEIAVVVGERMRQVRPNQALQHVRGIACANDVTARDLQKTDGQWGRAKGFDTFCPLGPVQPLRGDWSALEVITRLNGEERQRGRARDMLFGIPDLLAYISSIMTLDPEDVVLTGTPEGVGPLTAGDVVEVEIAGVGILRNPVIASEAA